MPSKPRAESSAKKYSISAQYRKPLITASSLRPAQPSSHNAPEEKVKIDHFQFLCFDREKRGPENLGWCRSQPSTSFQGPPRVIRVSPILMCLQLSFTSVSVIVACQPNQRPDEPLSCVESVRRYVRMSSLRYTGDIAPSASGRCGLYPRAV